MEVWIRDAGPVDAEALAEVFFRAIREGAAPKYTEAERIAWAPEQPSGAAWAERLSVLDTVMAEGQGEPLGFMAYDANGYLDLAFVHPDARGKGVTDALYAVLESRALAAGMPKLTTHASLMARSFFTRHGWSMSHPETIERNGEHLQRFAMEKRLRGHTG